MTTILVLIIVVLFASIATAYASTVRSASLRRKFESLGKIPGRTMDEILAQVGKPNSRVKQGADREILFWRRINFQVMLSFTNGICDGVEYEGR